MKPNQLTALLILVIVISIIASLALFVNGYSHFGVFTSTVTIYTIVLLIVRSTD